MTRVVRKIAKAGLALVFGGAVALTSAVALSALILDIRFPTINLDGLTLAEARALLGEPTNRWYGPFDPNWSGDIRLMGVMLAEKTIFAHSLWDPEDRTTTTRVAWRFPFRIHLNHGYEMGHAVGLFCYTITPTFECSLEI